MKINENDIRMMNRMMAAEMLLKEAMVGTEDAESRNLKPNNQHHEKRFPINGKSLFAFSEGGL